MLKKILPKNISNKVVGLVIIILILIGGLLIWYFGPLRKGELQELTIKTGKPGDLKLVKFSTDVVSPVEIEGIPSNNFSKNDKIGIEGKVNIQKPEVLVIRIFNQWGGEIQRAKPSIQFKSDGRIIICCIIPPEEPGEYVLNFFLNSEKAPIFPLLFKVSP